MKSRGAHLAMLLAAVSFTGCLFCGTPGYDEKVYKSWDELQFGLQSERTDLAKQGKSGVSIKLPLIFPSKYDGINISASAILDPPVRTGERESTTNKINERNHPPGTRGVLDSTPGGLTKTYEVWVEKDLGDSEEFEQGARWPVYCYVFGPTNNPSSLPSPEALKGVYTEEGEEPPEVEEVEIDSDGNIIAARISYSGTMPFAVLEGKYVESTKQENGRIDYYAVTNGQQFVIVAWRAPLDIAKELYFFEAAAKSMRSISFPQEKEAADGDGSDDADASAT